MERFKIIARLENLLETDLRIVLEVGYLQSGHGKASLHDENNGIIEALQGVVVPFVGKYCAEPAANDC
jgi:hypothetical protein